MITQAAQNTGLFHVNYIFAGLALLEPLFVLSLTVNPRDKTISGAGRITETASPPLDVRTTLHGLYTFMTVMPDKRHLLVIASGHGPVSWPSGGAVGPVPPLNVELSMILSSDWKSGVASYRYLNAHGTWREASNVPVHQYR